MKVTLSNNFHNTEINVMMPNGGKLTNRQSRRVKSALCVSDDCSCKTITHINGYPVDGYAIVVNIRVNDNYDNDSWHYQFECHGLCEDTYFNDQAENDQAEKELAKFIDPDYR